jgi:ABC-type lipoprotein export system ATPase subunit
VSPGRHAVPEPDDGFFAGETDGTYFDLELEVPEHNPRHAPSFEHRQLVAGSVHADAVTYARAGRTILDAVSVSVAPGEALAVVGPSGSGKSSLLAVLAGLEPPDSGSVHRDHDDTAGPDGLVLQGYGLVSVLTAAENVEAPLQAGALGRLGRAEVRQRAAAALDSVGLTEVADHLVEELSGGQQQRAAVARALAIDPSVLFADELTAELDHEWKVRVVELVLAVAERGGIVVLATHDPETAALCDHRLHLVDGRVAQLT